MSDLVLQSPRLEIILQSPTQVLARVEAMSPADRAEVSPEWLERVRTAAVGDPWANFFAVRDRATGADVGSCGFKGPPDSVGAVELAYGIEEEFRGRGFATEAARALTNFALAQPGVHIVRAHTRPTNDASATVLTKCGFRNLGEVTDPEDGLVWRWERGAG